MIEAAYSNQALDMSDERDQNTIDSDYDDLFSTPDDDEVDDIAVTIDSPTSIDGIDSSYIPFSDIHKPPQKFTDTQRKVFIPHKDIDVKILDYERGITSHLLNPNLYTIQFTHGDYTWTVKRRYKHFQNLHQTLKNYRTSLRIPLPTKAHKERRESFRENSTATSSDGKKKNKISLPRFPRKPESLVSYDNITHRMIQLETYLRNLLKLKAYRNHHETLNFMEVSHLSFVSGLGIKGKEGIILKRTGSTRPAHGGCNFFGLLSNFICVRCGYLCSDLCARWRHRWLFIKDSCLGYIRPKDGRVKCVMLFDSGFEVSSGMYATGLHNGFLIQNNSRQLHIKCWTKRRRKDWIAAIKDAVHQAQDFTLRNPYNSFAPLRPQTEACWFVDGCSYMAALADALEAATEEIFIADWWLSPEIYLKRPVTDDDADYWRLDKVLTRRANAGVHVFVMLYKEVELALGINSYYSKKRLAESHPNIRVLRHPDHAKGGVLFWAHHEKIIVIDQTYAFLGGIDLCYGRWDDHEHRLTDLGGVSQILALLPSLHPKKTSSRPLAGSTSNVLKHLAASSNVIGAGIIGTSQPNLAIQTPEEITPVPSQFVHVNAHITQKFIKLEQEHSNSEEKIKADTPPPERHTFLGLRSPDWTGRNSHISSNDEDDNDSEEGDTLGSLQLRTQQIIIGKWRTSRDRTRTWISKLRRSMGVEDGGIVPGKETDSTVTETTECFGDDIKSAGGESLTKPVPDIIFRNDETDGEVIITPGSNSVFTNNKIVATKDDIQTSEDKLELATEVTETTGNKEEVIRTESDATEIVVARISDVGDEDMKKLEEGINNLLKKKKKKVKYKIDRANSDVSFKSTTPHVELTGVPKYWIGKDYTNFIVKDFNNLEQPYQDLVDRNTTPRMPWHDIGMMVQGAAARDVARHFIQRWNAIKLEKAKVSVSYPYLLPKSYQDVKDGITVPMIADSLSLNKVTCQVVRSVCSWSAGFLDPDVYEQSIHEAYVEVIDKSRHYVYIENQFFVTLGVHGVAVRNQVAAALYRRILRAHKEGAVYRVYVVMPLLPGFEGEVGSPSGAALHAVTHWNYASISRGKHALLNRLSEAGIQDPSKYISFYGLRTHSILGGDLVTELIYVHSKLLIADDDTVICGSANINDRSMLGQRDSEIAVVIRDEEFEDGIMNGSFHNCGVFAGGLRRYLFREHLGLLVASSNADERAPDISDPVSSHFYHDVWMKTATENTRIYEEVFRCIPSDEVLDFQSLKQYVMRDALCYIDPPKASNMLNGVKGHIVNLPLHFLENAVLTPAANTVEGMMPTHLWT